MASRLGVYWSVAHRRPQDYEYFKRLNPSVIKVMDGGDNDYKWIRDNLPNSLVVARIHALSEQHEDMLKDPHGTGVRHANEWRQHQARLGFDPAKTLVLGINEPRVWEPGIPEALRIYTIAMCMEAEELGLRVGAMQLSVGWPNNTGPDTPPNWEPFHGVDNAIRRCNGALVCHEYWADNGPGELWGWWAGRALKCTWDVPIVIGECGIDMYVKDGSVQRHERGWLGRKEPKHYARELAEYVGRMSADNRFVGCCVFASDFADDDWYSFDVEPAYQAILNTPIPHVEPVGPPVTTHIPVIGGGPSPAFLYVNAPAGLRLRAAANTDSDTLAIVPNKEQVRVIGVSNGQGWVRVRVGDKEGFMASAYLTLTPPEPELPEPPTPPKPTGDTWERAWPIVLKFEGGLSLDPNDSGNYYQGKLVGTKYGISARVWGGQYDIPNLTKEQALAIYRKHYWEAVGAHRAAWPYSLLLFDTAVQHGVGAALGLRDAKPSEEEIYLGLRALRYVHDPKWRNYGVAWGLRLAHLHDIVKGEIEA